MLLKQEEFCADAPEHQGQAESITTDEIERAYDIAIMNAGHIK